MDSISEPDIRASFVNATKGDVRRMNLPSTLGELPWEELDFLGWTDPRAPLQCYLVVPTPDAGLVGVQMRRNVAAGGRARMCSLCLTTHSGTEVSLMVAPRAGRSGREGNTFGQDICTQLQCSSFVRGTLTASTPSPAQETLGVEERVARLQRNLEIFANRARRS